MYGITTLIADAPTTPSLVAEIVTGPPSAMPVTSPFASTDAMASFDDCQVTTRPVSVLSAASNVVAMSCTVCPTSRLWLAGDTSTRATGIGDGALVTVMAA